MAWEDLIKVDYPDLLIYWNVVRDVKVTKKECKVIKEVESWIRENRTIEELVNDPIVRSLRDYLWRLGIDPTKERPSSEALVRRVLNNKPLPRINTVVDAGNAAAAKTLIPISVFDMDKIAFPARLRAAKKGEKMIGIGGKVIEIVEGFPILEDSDGKIFSATLYRDGDETKVTFLTKNVLVVGYAPSDILLSKVKHAVRLTIEFINECCK